MVSRKQNLRGILSSNCFISSSLGLQATVISSITKLYGSKGSKRLCKIAPPYFSSASFSSTVYSSILLGSSMQPRHLSNLSEISLPILFNQAWYSSNKAGFNSLHISSITIFLISSIETLRLSGSFFFAFTRLRKGSSAFSIVSSAVLITSLNCSIEISSASFPR